MRRSGARLGSAARSSGVIKRSTLAVSLGCETGCRVQLTGITSGKAATATRQDLLSCIAIRTPRFTDKRRKESHPSRAYISLIVRSHSDAVRTVNNAQSTNVTVKRAERTADSVASGLQQIVCLHRSCPASSTGWGLQDPQSNVM